MVGGGAESECDLHVHGNSEFTTLCNSVAVRGGRAFRREGAFRRERGDRSWERAWSSSTTSSTMSSEGVASYESVRFARAWSASPRCLEGGGLAGLREDSVAWAIAFSSDASSYSSSPSSLSLTPSGRSGSIGSVGSSSEASSPRPSSLSLELAGAGRAPRSRHGTQARFFGGITIAHRDLDVPQRKLLHLARLGRDSDVLLVQELRSTQNDLMSCTATAQVSGRCGGSVPSLPVVVP